MATDASPAEFGYVTPENLGLFTDLYEMTMLSGYRSADHDPEATFSLFFRDLPADRGYLIAAGLEQVIHYVESLSFGERALSYLGEQGFDEAFLEFLADFEFTGEVRALPEGTAVFPDEPMLEVTAPISQAQLFETLAINQLGYQSLVATKAARMADQVDRFGDDQTLVDFGSRRAHGVDAGMKAARGAYVGGFDGTSNVAAGEAFDVPISGTMAHSWVQSFPTERAAFEAFAEVYGDDMVLLVDTYDTVEGARVAVDVADKKGVDLAGVRLDSGDLAALSREVEPIVGDADVFISSGVDEYLIQDFFERDGIADGFGPGTALTTSADAPKLDIVYKLVAVERDGEHRPTMKLSSGKATYPGRKSVHRVERDGTFEYDVVGLRDEDLPGEDQLVTVFEDGELVYDLPDLEAISERTSETLSRIPLASREIRDPDPYDVRISDELRAETASLRRQLEADRAP